MTFPAFRETGMHRLGMWLTVAAAAFRDRLMLISVTSCTGNLGVLGLTLGQYSGNRIVTRSAKFRCRAVRISDGQRHMGLVACRTVGLSHRLGVWLMTCRTLGNVAVGIGMAEIAGKGCMMTRVRNHLLFGAGVTTHANGLLLALDADVQGLMRVVTAETIVDLVMCAAVVALAALGDIVRYAWPVSGMTGPAVDFGFVGRAVCLDLCRLFSVTLDAVIGS